MDGTPLLSQGPPMVPAEGGPKIFQLKSSWGRRRRSKISAVSLTRGRLQPVLMRPTPQLSVKTGGGGGWGGSHTRTGPGRPTMVSLKHWKGRRGEGRHGRSNTSLPLASTPLRAPTASHAVVPCLFLPTSCCRTWRGLAVGGQTQCSRCPKPERVRTPGSTNRHISSALKAPNPCPSPRLVSSVPSQHPPPKRTVPPCSSFEPPVSGGPCIRRAPPPPLLQAKYNRENP